MENSEFTTCKRYKVVYLFITLVFVFLSGFAAKEFILNLSEPVPSLIFIWVLILIIIIKSSIWMLLATITFTNNQLVLRGTLKNVQLGYTEMDSFFITRLGTTPHNILSKEAIIRTYILGINLKSGKTIYYPLNGIAGTGANTTTSLKNIRELFSNHNVKDNKREPIYFANSPVQYMAESTKAAFNIQLIL